MFFLPLGSVLSTTCMVSQTISAFTNVCGWLLFLCSSMNITVFLPIQLYIHRKFPKSAKMCKQGTFYANLLFVGLICCLWESSNSPYVLRLLAHLSKALKKLDSHLQHISGFLNFAPYMQFTGTFVATKMKLYFVNITKC